MIYIHTQDVSRMDVSDKSGAYEKENEALIPDFSPDM